MVSRGAPPVDQDVVLDAAATLLTAYGVRRVSLQDIASAAGVSRQSLYRWFGDRDGVVRAVIARERDRFVDAALAAADREDDLSAAVHALLTETLQRAATHPLLNRLRHSDPEMLLPLLASSEDVVTATVSAIASQFLTARRPDADPARVADAADVLTRLVVSYLIQPPTAPPERIAAIVATLVTVAISDQNEVTAS